MCEKYLVSAGAHFLAPMLKENGMQYGENVRKRRRLPGIQHENKNALPAEKHPDCLLHASLCKWQPGRFSASAHFLCWILGFCSIKKENHLKTVYMIFQYRVRLQIKYISC